MASSDLFQVLRKYVRGQADKYDLERSDPSVYRVIENSTRGLSQIQFEFKNDEDFLKKMDLGDDDIFFAQRITSPYSNWGFRDISQIEDDFVQGYILFDDMNEENLSKIKRILKIIDPGYDFTDLGDRYNEEANQRAAQSLMRIYPKEINSMLDCWYSENESSATQVASETIESDINAALSENEFKMVRRWDTISTTVGNLIMLYLKSGRVWESFRGLFKDLYEREKTGLGGWSENTYEYENSTYFDKEGLNRCIERDIDKILDGMEDDDKIKEFIDFYNRITNKFKVGVTYDLPKLKNVQFRIKDFDRENMKVDVVLRNGLRTINRKVSEDNFYKLLYQPELFHSEFGSV